MDGGEGHRSLEIEEDEEEIVELESEEEVEAIELEDKYEDEDEDEDFKELGELKAPVVTSWKGVNGETIHGIMVINDELTDPKNKCHLDVCPICYHSWTSHGNHQICCLPCGHMYGLSCIKKWLRQSSSGGKCPQCNTFCSDKDVILLYAPQKASSNRHFPFTRQGSKDFMRNERLRWRDAESLCHDVVDRLSHVSQQILNADNQQIECIRQWNDVRVQLDELVQRAETLGQPAEELGEPAALQSQANSLARQADAFCSRAEALEKRAHALDRLVVALNERIDEYIPRLNFFLTMCEEHQLKKKNAKPCTATPTCHKN